MADSIDEFFAKKDKSKKGKAKSKYTTSETIAKKLEEGGKEKKEPVPKKDIKDKIQISSNNQSIIIPSIVNDQEDDEWKDIEEEERDYSGLKILQALSMSEKEKEEEQLKEQMLSEQNGDSVKQADGQSGPWKFMQQTPTPEVEKVQPPPEPVKEETPKPTGTYKPPALRNAASSTPQSSSKRYHKNAPPISSELDFPTLSSAAECNKWKMSEADSRNFQSVKHGIRSKGESQKELQLDLENKFSALPQEK